MGLPPPLKKALEEASKSSYKQKVGAVIAKCNRVVSKGHNKFRHHQYSSYYPYTSMCHAEVAALLNNKSSSRNLSIHVARINNKGEARLARPCESCMKVLQANGIKNIYYTTNKGYNVERI